MFFLMVCEKLFLELPTALVSEKSLHPADLRLYMQISLNPGLSITELAGLTGYGREAIRSQCKRLSSCGWVTVVTEGIRKVAYLSLIHILPRTSRTYGDPCRCQGCLKPRFSP